VGGGRHKVYDQLKTKGGISARLVPGQASRETGGKNFLEWMCPQVLKGGAHRYLGEKVKASGGASDWSKNSFSKVH